VVPQHLELPTLPDPDFHNPQITITGINSDHHPANTFEAQTYFFPLHNSKQMSAAQAEKGTLFFELLEKFSDNKKEVAFSQALRVAAQPKFGLKAQVRDTFPNYLAAIRWEASSGVTSEVDALRNYSESIAFADKHKAALWGTVGRHLLATGYFPSNCRLSPLGMLVELHYDLIVDDDINAAKYLARTIPMMAAIGRAGHIGLDGLRKYFYNNLQKPIRLRQPEYVQIMKSAFFVDKRIHVASQKEKEARIVSRNSNRVALNMASIQWEIDVLMEGWPSWVRAWKVDKYNPDHPWGKFGWCRGLIAVALCTGARLIEAAHLSHFTVCPEIIPGQLQMSVQVLGLAKKRDDDKTLITKPVLTAKGAAVVVEMVPQVRAALRAWYTDGKRVRTWQACSNMQKAGALSVVMSRAAQALPFLGPDKTQVRVLYKDLRAIYAAMAYRKFYSRNMSETAFLRQVLGHTYLATALHYQVFSIE
jgi:hypothetical protein